MKTTKYSWILLLFLSLYSFAVTAKTVKSETQWGLSNLKVEYTETPIGLDTETPRFSWQMQADNKTRGNAQKAFQMIVKDPTGKIVWNSGKKESGLSLGIEYGGEKLKPTTQYKWSVTVWNQLRKTATAESWFETGLMSPNISAWDGAKWIGGSAYQMPLYAPYLEVFKLSYTVQLDKESATKKAGFVFGANDSRLMDKYKNILQLENKLNESYIKLELDFSKVDGANNNLALFNIYRVGYDSKDHKDVPFKSFEIPATILNKDNIYKPHDIYLEAVAGTISIWIDGKKYKIPKAINLNPMEKGGNTGCYPMLGEIGFAIEAGKKASFSDITIKNYRTPSNVIFSDNLSSEQSYKGVFSSFIANGLTIRNNAYQISGGKTGNFIVADPSRNAMPMLRTVFDSEQKNIAKARLYVTSRGVYELYLNGEKVGDDYFNPGLTQYDKTQLYQAYDVTKSIKSGKNAIGVMLGEGWWSGQITYMVNLWNYFGDRQSFLMKLVLTYEDGSTKVITSDPSTWKYYNDGPIACGSFFQGEVYDARKEAAIAGWSTAGYNDSKWSKATEVATAGTTFTNSSQKPDEILPLGNFDNTSIIGNIGDNVRIVKELKAISVEEVRPGLFVYDMGQNMVGFPKININGTSGKKITLRYAEMKYPDLPEYSQNKGLIMTENLREALSQDIYILKGGYEVIQPRFTYHGYRYVEISGIDKALVLQAVKGEVISSVREMASSYHTSNTDVNKLWENISWSTRGNFVSIPTDCPQRNERMGWSGDLSVFSRTASYMANVPQFFRRHMLAMRDLQNPEGRFPDVAPIGGGFGGILWGSAGITVPWETYQQYGDKVMLAEHYEAMKRYSAYLTKNIDTKTGFTKTGLLGDWLSPEGSKPGANNINYLIWDAYHVYNLEIMQKVATILGKSEDAVQFANLYIERKAHVNNTFVDPQTKKIIHPDTKKNIDLQAVYAIPLGLGVFNDEYKSDAATNLTEIIKRKNADDKGNICPEYSLMTGFIGTAWISKALSDTGNNSVAYRLLQQTSYPSWLYPVKQGATTIWERLNSYTVENGFGGNNGMNSFNHYSFGAVGAWMYNYSLGIQRDEKSPAFKHFILQPTPDPDKVMTFARGYYDSMYGRIESAWNYSKGKLVYTTTVPANTTATLYLPTSDIKTVIERGKPVVNSAGVKFLKYENGKAVFELLSGSYQFEF